MNRVCHSFCLVLKKRKRRMNKERHGGRKGGRKTNREEGREERREGGREGESRGNISLPFIRSQDPCSCPQAFPDQNSNPWWKPASIYLCFFLPLSTGHCRIKVLETGQTRKMGLSVRAKSWLVQPFWSSPLGKVCLATAQYLVRIFLSLVCVSLGTTSSG